MHLFNTVQMNPAVGIRVCMTRWLKPLPLNPYDVKQVLLGQTGEIVTSRYLTVHARGILPCRLLSELLVRKRNHEGVSIRRHIFA
jgi:hypothetical protein